MMLAQPGWLAFVNTFHIATITSSAMSSPKIIEIGLLRACLSAVLDLCEQACGREQNGLRNFDELVHNGEELREV